MLTRSDLLDVFLRHMLPTPFPRGSSAGARPRPRGRSFLTEYEIKKALTPGAKDLTIPKDAIVSPLAQEWLALKGIRIIYK